MQVKFLYAQNKKYATLAPSISPKSLNAAIFTAQPLLHHPDLKFEDLSCKDFTMSTIVEQQATIALEPFKGFVFPLSDPPPPYDAKQAVVDQIAFSPSSPSTTAEGESEEIQFQEYESEAALQLSPESQAALVVTPGRAYQLVHDFPAPTELGPQEVRIRNHATGLNHIDWKSVDYNFCLPELPWITGREMAGVVDKVGSAVSRVKTGDIVWTSKCSPLLLPATHGPSLHTCSWLTSHSVRYLLQR